MVSEVHSHALDINNHLSSTQHNANCTDNQFIDQFTEWLSENLGTLPNVVIIGDFNIHVNYTELDNNAHIFSDTLEALGLQIHNDFQCIGWEIHWIYSLVKLSQVQIDRCWAGPFISDHSTIGASLSISRSDLIKKHI